MHPQQLLVDLVEQFCTYQRKQRGKTEGGVRTYRWNLDQLLTFVRTREGRAARVGDLTPETVRAWMDQMAEADLALSTMRSRQSTLSSLCAWLVKRDGLTENPVAKLDRPRYERTPPRQVPGAELMDALITAAKRRQRPRDIAIFLILRYTGMRRESVASLRQGRQDPRHPPALGHHEVPADLRRARAHTRRSARSRATRHSSGPGGPDGTASAA